MRCDGEQAGADGWEHLFGSRPDYTVMYTVFSALVVWSSPGVAKTARAHARHRDASRYALSRAPPDGDAESLSNDYIDAIKMPCTWRPTQPNRGGGGG